MWWCWCTEFSLVGVLCSNFWVVTFVPLAELVWWWFVCAAFWLVGVLCSWFLIGHLCVAGWGGVGARDDDIGPVRAQARQSSVLLLQKSIERIRGNMGEEANVVIFTAFRACGGGSLATLSWRARERISAQCESFLTRFAHRWKHLCCCRKGRRNTFSSCLIWKYIYIKN